MTVHNKTPQNQLDRILPILFSVSDFKDYSPLLRILLSITESYKSYQIGEISYE